MTVPTPQPTRASGPRDDRSLRPGSLLARRRVRVLLVATALLALLCVPALVGVASADAVVVDSSIQNDDSTASGPTITVDPEQPMAGTRTQFQLSNGEESVDRAQWEVLTQNGTVLERRALARDGLDVPWTDADVSNTTDPAEFDHEFSSNGNYTIRATFGEDATTVDRSVSVRPQRLTASLVVDDTEPVVGQPVTVIPDGEGDITDVRFDDDGAEVFLGRADEPPTSPLPLPYGAEILTFREPGEYELALTVENANGVTDDNRTTVDVRPDEGAIDARLRSNYDGPEAGIWVNREVTFDASGTSGNVSEYWWEFGDGELDRTTSPTTTYWYEANGTYEVAVTAVGANGTDRATVRRTVGAEPADPELSVSLEDEYVEGLVQFQASPSTDWIKEYRWKFPSGNRSTATKPVMVRTVSEPGRYSVSATLVPWVGESVTLNRTFWIEGTGSEMNLSVSNETVVEPADWGSEKTGRDEHSESDDGSDGESDTGDSGDEREENEDRTEFTVPVQNPVPSPDTSNTEPSFEIQSVDVPEGVEAGSDVEVTVQTENDGGAGSGEVTVWLPDSAQQHVDVSGESDEVEVVTTTIAAPAEPGEYDLQVKTASDEQTATLSVADSAGEGAENETEPTPSSDDSADGMPAVGVLGSLLAFAAGALAVRRRS